MKWYGNVLFVETEEQEVDRWIPVKTLRPYAGEVLRCIRKWDSSQTNPRSNKYQFAYKNEGMDEVMAPYYQLVIKAMEIYDDMEARYLAFAEAEAYLIEHAILIPFGFTTGGYTASRIDPFTVQFTA